MTCFIDGCITTVKARGMCNTHYHAWWVLQPKENRNSKKGRPKKQTVSYWGMHSRLKINKGYASEHLCVDCEGQASDWSWDGTCDDIKYGLAKAGRPSLSPYCLHLEHYKSRCTDCHMKLDLSLSSNVLI
jgi:hypothetical protein